MSRKDQAYDDAYEILSKVKEANEIYESTPSESLFIKDDEHSSGEEQQLEFSEMN